MLSCLSTVGLKWLRGSSSVNQRKLDNGVKVRQHKYRMLLAFVCCPAKHFTGPDDANLISYLTPYIPSPWTPGVRLPKEGRNLELCKTDFFATKVVVVSWNVAAGRCTSRSLAPTLTVRIT